MSRSQDRIFTVSLLAVLCICADGTGSMARVAAQAPTVDPSLLNAYRWRSIGPNRGGRSIAAAGVKGRLQRSVLRRSGRRPLENR